MFALNEFVNNVRTPHGAGIDIINSSDIMGQGMHYDPGLMRPYLAENGQVYVDVTVGNTEKRDANGEVVYNSEGTPVMVPVREPQSVYDRMRQGKPVLYVNNATALRKDQWTRLDNVVLKAVRKRLQAYADLRANVTYGGFDGMSTPILEHEIMTDPGEAMADMDGLSEGRNFAPKFALQGLPLPITHSDFFLSSRFLAASRTKGQPQDTIRMEIAGRRVGELIEKTTIGTVAGTQYGISTDYLNTSKVYGYLTHPDVISYTSLPTSAATQSNIATTGGVTLVNAIIQMVAAAADQNFYGPFVMYVSTAYDNLLNNDYKASTSSDLTIRQRILQIDQISKIQRLDHMSGDYILLVQMTEDVVQAVNGMEVTTVQWETKGGMQLNFKVMGIQVPRIRSVYVGPTTAAETAVTGVVKGTTS